MNPQTQTRPLHTKAGEVPTWLDCHDMHYGASCPLCGAQTDGHATRYGAARSIELHALDGCTSN